MVSKALEKKTKKTGMKFNKNPSACERQKEDHGVFVCAYVQVLFAGQIGLEFFFPGKADPYFFPLQ